MPEIRYYTVTQQRQVQVTANNVCDATRLAEKAFEEGQASNHGLWNKLGLDGVWGDTTSKIREISLHAKEGR